MNQLALPKNKVVKRPTRKPDHLSKRGVPYWFAPEWVRDVNGTVGRIIPVASGEHGGARLHMLAKSGNLSYIQGSIQEEYQNWHRKNGNNIVSWRDDFEFDCILLGVEPKDILLSDWEYEDKKEKI